MGRISNNVRKLRLDLSVTDYGARGDWNGSSGTDNLSAFNAAFSDAVSIATASGAGVTIRIPRGRFRLTNEWNVYRANSPRIDISIEGEDQLSTKLVSDFYGAGKAVIKCRDPAGTGRASPLSVRRLGFECVSTSGGVNPVFIDVLGHGESRLEELRFGSSNNTHLRSISGQNIRMRDVVSFYGGKHFNYKATSGFTFSVDTATNTITASAAIFSAGDVGKKFFILPTDTTRRISYTIATYVDSTHVTYSESISDLTQTAVSGHFEPARASITSGDTTLTANAACFTSNDVGRVIYVRNASAGAYGSAILRATIASYTSATEVELDIAATATATDQYFGVATIDLGLPPGWDGSSDVKINALHVEHYDGIGLVCQNTDSYQIVQSKIHGETSPSDTAKSLAAIWLDDHGGRFEIELDSSCSMSDARVYVCNLNDLVLFDTTVTRGIINGKVFKTELFSSPDGYLAVRGLNSYIAAGGDPYALIEDANYTADSTDSRIMLTGEVNMVGDSQKARYYVGRGTYFTPEGRLISPKLLGDSVIPTTITWDGTAPTGETKRYRWEQVGSMVYFSLRAEYSTPGTTNTSVTIPLPSDMPAPSLLSGTANNELVGASVSGLMATASSGVAPALTKTYMIGDGSGGYQLKVVLNSSNIAASIVIVSGFYFTT
jgi:hypothetical protein